MTETRLYRFTLTLPDKNMVTLDLRADRESYELLLMRRACEEMLEEVEARLYAEVPREA